MDACTAYRMAKNVAINAAEDQPELNAKLRYSYQQKRKGGGCRSKLISVYCESAFLQRLSLCC